MLEFFISGVCFHSPVTKQGLHLFATTLAHLSILMEVLLLPQYELISISRLQIKFTIAVLMKSSKKLRTQEELVTFCLNFSLKRFMHTLWSTH